MKRYPRRSPRRTKEQASERPHRMNAMQAKLMAVCVFVIAASGLLSIALLKLITSFDLLPEAMGPFALPFITVFISIITGIFISFFILRWMLKPVHEFTEATERVIEGDYSVRIDARNKGGELWGLQRSFNHMIEELESTELFRNDFIDDFSHEFKTPIVSIHGFSKQLLEDDISDEQRREYSRIIFDESQRLTELSSSVLLLSKIENQQLVTNRSWFELDEQIRRCILSFTSRWEEKGLEMVPELDDVRICANAELLENIWRNLIDNAIKFSPEGGTVRISCREKGRNKVAVEVADQGEGMEESVAARVFDKFYQGDPSHATQGNGIGLSVVKRIVELCDGETMLVTAPGEGATFTVILPLCERNPPTG